MVILREIPFCLFVFVQAFVAWRTRVDKVCVCDEWALDWGYLDTKECRLFASEQYFTRSNNTKNTFLCELKYDRFPQVSWFEVKGDQSCVPFSWSECAHWRVSILCGPRAVGFPRVLFMFLCVRGHNSTHVISWYFICYRNDATHCLILATDICHHFI